MGYTGFANEDIACEFWIVNRFKKGRGKSGKGEDIARVDLHMEFKGRRISLGQYNLDQCAKLLKTDYLTEYNSLVQFISDKSYQDGDKTVSAAGSHVDVNIKSGDLSNWFLTFPNASVYTSKLKQYM